MLKLSVYPAGFGEISGSPFATKAICLMEMSGQPYELDVNPDPRKSPKKKFPVLQDEGQIIPDSDQIRDHLETKFGVDFDTGLSAEQRAISRMVIRAFEENVYFGILASRWMRDDHWVLVKGEFFKGMPPLIGGFIAKMVRKGVVAQCVGQGMGRHSVEEQVARVAKDIDAFSTLLGDKAFLHGDAPTSADASAVPMLRAMAAFPKQNALSDLVINSAQLMAYIEHGKEAMYPK
jgi:glutathione S-transferase